MQMPDGTIINCEINPVPNNSVANIENRSVQSFNVGVNDLPSAMRTADLLPRGSAAFQEQNMASSGGHLLHPGGPCSGPGLPPLINSQRIEDTNLQVNTNQVNLTVPSNQTSLVNIQNSPHLMQNQATILAQNSHQNSMNFSRDMDQIRNNSQNLLPQAQNVPARAENVLTQAQNLPQAQNVQTPVQGVQNVPRPAQVNVPITVSNLNGQENGRPNDPTMVTPLSENLLNFYEFLDRTSVQRASQMSILRGIPEGADLPNSTNMTNQELLMQSNINFQNTSVFSADAEHLRARQNMESTRVEDGSLTPVPSVHVNALTHQRPPLQSTGLAQQGGNGLDLFGMAPIEARRPSRRALTPQVQVNPSQVNAVGPQQPQANQQNLQNPMVNPNAYQQTPLVRFNPSLLTRRQRQPAPVLGSQPITYSVPRATGVPAAQPAQDYPRIPSQNTPDSFGLPNIPQAAPRNSTALGNQQNLVVQPPVQAQAQVPNQYQLPASAQHVTRPSLANSNRRPVHSVTPVPDSFVQEEVPRGPAQAGAVSGTNDHREMAQAITTLGRMHMMMHSNQQNMITMMQNQSQNNSGNNGGNNSNTNNNSISSSTLRPKTLSEINKLKPPKWTYHESESLIRCLTDFELYSLHHNLNQAETRYALRMVFRIKGASGQEEAQQVIDEAGQDLTTKAGRMKTYKKLVSYFQPEHTFTFRRKRTIDSFYNCWQHLRTLLSFDDSEGEIDSSSPILKRRAWKKLIETGNDILSPAEKRFLRARALEADIMSILDDEIRMRNFLNVSFNIWKINNAEQVPAQEDFRGKRGGKSRAVNAVRADSPPRAPSLAETFQADSPVKSTPPEKTTATAAPPSKPRATVHVQAVGNTCFVCGSPNHFMADCPDRDQNKKFTVRKSGYVPKTGYVPKEASKTRCTVRNCPKPEEHTKANCPFKCTICLKNPKRDPEKLGHTTADHKPPAEYWREKQEREAQGDQASGKGFIDHVQMEIFHQAAFINMITRQCENVSTAEGQGGRYLYVTSVFPDERAIDAVIDTGCTCDGVLDEHVAAKNGIRGEIISQNVQVKLANGSQTTSAKTMKTHLTIGGKKLAVTLLLMPVSVPTGLLIGKPVLQRLGLLRTLESAAADLDQITKQASYKQVAKSTSRPPSKNRS